MGNPYDIPDDDPEYQQMLKAFGVSTAPPPPPSGGLATDIPKGVLKGALQIPGMITGLGDIVASPISEVTGGKRPFSRAADWAGEKTGFQPEKWAQGIHYSPATEQAVQEVNDTKGFFPTLGAYATHPRAALTAAAESLPSMGGAGVGGRLAMKGLMGAEKYAALRAAAAGGDEAAAAAAREELLRQGAVAGGIGEGVVSAGQNMQQTDADVDPLRAAGSALAAGAITGAIGAGSGKLANRLGLEDIQSDLAAGVMRSGKKNLLERAKSVGKGFLQEGALEEMPQSYQEQVWQNIAEGKPWDQGAAEAAAQGLVVGGMMGGGVNAVTGLHSRMPAPQDAPKDDKTPVNLLALPHYANPTMVSYQDGSVGFADRPEDNTMANAWQRERVSDHEAAIREDADRAERGLDLLNGAQGVSLPVNGEVLPGGTVQDVPMPTDVGSAVSLLQMAANGAMNGQGIIAGSPIHQAIQEAQRVLTDNGMSYLAAKAPPVAGESVQKAKPAAPQAAPATEPKAPRSKFAQNVESLIQEHIAAGNLMADDPLVTEWNAGPKTASAAKATGAKLQGLVANSATPAAPAQQPSPALAPEKQALLAKYEKASERDKQVIRDVLGWDSEGNQVEQPLSYAEVGAKHKISDSRVQQILARFDIKKDTVDRLIGDSAVVEAGKEKTEEVEAPVQVTRYNKDGTVQSTEMVREYERGVRDKKGNLKGFKRVKAAQVIEKPVTAQGYTTGGNSTIAELLQGQGEDGEVGSLDKAGFSVIDRASDTKVDEAPSGKGSDEDRAIARKNVADTNAAEAALAGKVREDSPAEQARMEAQAAALKARSSSAEAVIQARREKEREAENLRYQKQILATPEAKTAAIDYNDAKSDTAPGFEELSTAQKVDFVERYIFQLDKDDSWEAINTLQRKFEQELDHGEAPSREAKPGVASASAGVQAVASGQSAEPAESPRAAETEAAPEHTEEPGAEAAVTPQTIAAAWDEAIAGSPLPKFMALNDEEQQWLLGAHDEESFNKRAQEVLDGRMGAAQFSKGSETQGTTRDAINAVVKELTGRGTAPRVRVVQSVDDLTPAERAAAEKDAGQQLSRDEWGQVQGFAVGGRVYLIADNIPAGAERAVFLHEVGSHLGLEKLLSKEQFARLTRQLQKWAEASDGSQESQLAKAALQRVEDAQTPEADRAKEHLAYFIEEAVKAGIDPTAMKYTSELQRWFRTLWAAFKSALEKLGLNPNKLNAKDIVDLAYGAADVALNGETLTASAETESYPHFSKTIQQTPQLRQTQSAVADTLKYWTKAARAKLGPSFMPWMFGHQLAAYVKDILPSTAKYFQSTDAKQRERVRAEENISRVYDGFQRLGKKEQNEVNSFVYDSTFGQKWGYAPAWDRNAKVDTDLKARFDSLSPAAQQTVKDVFQHGYDHFDALTEAINANLPAEDQVKRSKLDGPYAPLKRFGKYVVVGKSSQYQAAEATNNQKAMDALRSDEQHYYVEFKDSLAQALQRQDELADQIKGLTFDAKEAATESKLLQEAPFQAMERLKSIIESDDKLKEKTKDTLTSLANQLYVRSLSSLHARKSDLKRQNVAGADKDMMRAFVAQGRSDAALLATLKMNTDIQESLQAIRDEANKPGDKLKKSMALNEVLKRHVAMSTYVDAPWQDQLLKLSSLHFLLTSPAYFLTNATQPFVVSAPVIAGTHGAGKTTGALIAAWKDAWDNIKLFSPGGFDLAKIDALKGNVGQEGAALKELMDRNHLDIGMQLELGSVASGGGVFNKGLDKIVAPLRGLSRNVETLNRVSTALAAYRLEYTKQLNAGRTAEEAHAKATDYADQMLVDTHGVYDGHNAPRMFMPGNMPGMPVKLMAQFKKFQLIQLGLLVKLFRDGYLNGLSKEDAAAAKAGFRYLLGSQALLGGLYGLPAGAIAAFLAGAAGGGDGEDDEAFLRRMIGDNTLSQLLLHGLPAAAGLDISKRVGMGNVLNPLPFVDAGKDSKEALRNYTAAAFGGATLSMGLKMADGLGELDKGHYWRGLELMMPTGLANVSKAARYGTEGVTTRRGDITMHPEDIGFMTEISQVLGLPSTQLTDATWKASVKFNTEAHFKAQTSELEDRYARAVRDKDRGTQTELQQEWIKMQQARADLGFKRQPLSVMLKSPQAQSKRERHVVGGIEYTKGDRGFAQRLSEM